MTRAFLGLGSNLGDVELARAVAAGCTVVVNSDAHSIAGLDVMPYGVATVRRAGLGPEHVLNARSERAVRAFLAKRPSSDQG